MACRRVGELGEAVATVAADLGVGWGAVMRAVREHGTPLVDDPARLAGVAALGVDETAYLAATASHGTETQRLVTGEEEPGFTTYPGFDCRALYTDTLFPGKIIACLSRADVIFNGLFTVAPVVCSSVDRIESPADYRIVSAKGRYGITHMLEDILIRSI